MIYGTCYFPDRERAVKYYAQQMSIKPSQALREVTLKLAEGAIHLGSPPRLKPGDMAILIDGGLRFAIQERTPEEMRAQALSSLWEARARALDGDLP